MMDIRKRFCTTSELANILKVSPQTILNLVRKGMPHYKLGASIYAHNRYRLREVEMWLDENTKEVRGKWQE